MTRTEHLAWAKARAKAYIDQGDWLQAWNSFACNLMQHPALKNHSGLPLGIGRIMSKNITDGPTLWEHIEGYH